PHELRDDLRHAEEVLARTRLRDENSMEGRSLAELALPSETGMRIIAIRRDVRWIFGPAGDDVVQPGDVLFLQGPEEGIDLLRAVKEGAEPDDLRGLLHLAFASERIADAAQEMTRLAEGEDELHPVIAEALSEADEIVTEVEVTAEGPAAGKTLRELSLRTE